MMDLLLSDVRFGICRRSGIWIGKTRAFYQGMMLQHNDTQPWEVEQMKTTTKAVILAVVVLSIIMIASATAAKPIQQVKPFNQTNSTGNDFTGNILGKVTFAGDSAGIADTDVWIVNSSNTSQYYWLTKTDSTGSFQVAYVNNTLVDQRWVDLNFWDPRPLFGLNQVPVYVPLYAAYANHSVYGEGWSNNFTVEVNKNSLLVGITIIPRPTTIQIFAEKTGLVADRVDFTKVWAYVTDSRGNPVPANTQITFSYSNVSLASGNYTGFGNWTNAGNKETTVTVSTSGGYANTTFGWIYDVFAGNNTTLTATYKDPVSGYTISSSIKIYFQPTVTSWFGSVTDSTGKAIPGVKVVLHAGYFSGATEGTVINGHTVGTDGFVEVYNMSNPSFPRDDYYPYPGTFVFSNIILWNNVTHAYVSAEMEYQDGISISGKSNYYSLNKSATSSGFIMLNIPEANDIQLTANPENILVGGDTSIISAQLLLNGKPYKIRGKEINFYGTNDTIAYLPVTKKNVTDENGIATIILTSNATKGSLDVWGYHVGSVITNLTDNVTVHVVGWGTISGMVTDKNKNGVPGATVTLWTAKKNESGTWNTAVYLSPDNPQQTVSRPEVAAIGTYTYYRIPEGLYNVTAEKADAAGNNHLWFAVVNLTAEMGTATHNVAIPDLIISTPSITPTPTQTVTATPTPTEVPTVTPKPSPGFEIVFALAGLLGVAYLLARKEQ